MTEPTTAIGRAQARHAALLEGPVVSEGMPSGQAQVYIGMRNGEWSLYRSPDGRKIVWLEGESFQTSRAALARSRELTA